MRRNQADMSYVTADTDLMTSTASDLAALGANVQAAHKLAAPPTSSVLPAAADDVSSAIARVLSEHAANYQAMATRAAAFNDQFVQHLTAAAFSYADIEAALANLLQFGDYLWVIGNLIYTPIAASFAANPVGTIVAEAVVLLSLPVVIPLQLFFFIPLALGGFLVGSLLLGGGGILLLPAVILGS